MPNIKGLLNDPQFNQLDPASQRAALARVTGDSAFTNLSDSDYASFRAKMGAAGSQSTPQTEAPGFFGELYNQTAAPLMQVGSAASGPFGPIGAAYQIAKGAVSGAAQQGREAWQALTGQGDYQGYSPTGRISEAVGHALAAALPVIGPMAAKAGENFGEGNYGAGAADAAMALGPSAFGGALDAVDAIPNAARAGRAIEQVTNAARNVPIDTASVGNEALRIRDLAQSGGQMPKVVRDFINRAVNPKQGPITFQEARDFYNNASRLSADEYGRLTPVMKKAIGDFRVALHNSLVDAAGKVGMGDTYQNAINEYANAARLSSKTQTATDAAKDFALKRALPAAGLYELYRSLR